MRPLSRQKIWLQVVKHLISGPKLGSFCPQVNITITLYLQMGLEAYPNVGCVLPLLYLDTVWYGLIQMQQATFKRVILNYLTWNSNPQQTNPQSIYKQPSVGVARKFCSSKRTYVKVCYETDNAHKRNNNWQIAPGSINYHEEIQKMYILRSQHNSPVVIKVQTLSCGYSTHPQKVFATGEEIK